MKKLLLVLVLISGLVLFTTAKIGAKMNNETTQVRAQHILVLNEKEAQDIKTKIDANEITFEDAAREYSQCPSKSKGGDLGFFPRGVMVKEFEQAAFDAPIGTVSDPVKTQFGWHLIKVTEKK